MSERELKSITFEDLGITYVIPSSGSSSGDVPKVVEEHINSKDNPHGVTAAQVGAAPAQILSGAIQPSTAEELETQLKEMYTNMGINTRKFAYANITFAGASLSGGVWQLTLAKTTNDHGFIIAEHYGGANNTPAVKARTIYNGVWNDWVDVGASAFAPSGFGLGGNAVTAENADEISANGYYETGIQLGENFNSCIVWHNQHSANYAEQYAISVLGGDTGAIIHRTKLGGTWQPWEYLNPAMVEGNTYRTTERYNGKAVYKKKNANGIIAYQLEGDSDWKDGIPGAAPAGYGLGWAASLNAYNGGDLDTLTAPGWYFWDSKSASTTIVGISSQYWYVHVVAYGDGHLHCRQEIHPTTRNTYSPIVRKCSGGTWGEWAWENPPLNVGVEYRTTMYDNGKALYLQRGDNGAIFYRRNGEDTWYAMASRIDGTFANTVAANPTAQDPAIRQLRNSTITSTETTPSNNGEISWMYE